MQPELNKSGYVARTMHLHKETGLLSDQKGHKPNPLH